MVCNVRIATLTKCILSTTLCARSSRPTIAVLAAPDFLISPRSMQTPHAKRHVNNVIGGGEVHHRCLVLERFRAPSSPRIHRCPPKPQFPFRKLGSRIDPGSERLALAARLGSQRRTYCSKIRP